MATISSKITAAIAALPFTTRGNWWCDDRGEMHNDPIGSVKLAKFVDGGNPQQRDANRVLLSAARELAEEVVRLREALAMIDKHPTNGNSEPDSMAEALDQIHALAGAALEATKEGA